MVTINSTFYDITTGTTYSGDSYVITDIITPILNLAVPIYAYNRMIGGALETVANELFNNDYTMWENISEQVPLYHPCEVVANTIIPMPSNATLQNKNVNSSNIVVRPI